MALQWLSNLLLTIITIIRDPSFKKTISFLLPNHLVDSKPISFRILRKNSDDLNNTRYLTTINNNDFYYFTMIITNHNKYYYECLLPLANLLLSVTTVIHWSVFSFHSTVWMSPHQLNEIEMARIISLQLTDE